MKSNKQLKNFVDYCLEHPEERFWQALRNWSGAGFIFWTDSTIDPAKVNKKFIDTFYWEEK